MGAKLSRIPLLQFNKFINLFFCPGSGSLCLRMVLYVDVYLMCNVVNFPGNVILLNVLGNFSDNFPIDGNVVVEKFLGGAPLYIITCLVIIYLMYQMDYSINYYYTDSFGPDRHSNLRNKIRGIIVSRKGNYKLYKLLRRPRKIWRNISFINYTPVYTVNITVSVPNR